MELRPIWLVATATLALAAAPVQEMRESLVAREAVERLETELRAELMAAMKSGGPAEALSVCQTRAPEIARTLGQETGCAVGRTALKVRNPANAPDAWERSTLKRFRRQLAAGEDPNGLVRTEVVEERGQKVLRYMKAIPMAEPCLSCHGEKLAPEVSARVRALYPEDRATGFKKGDLRGAFTVTVPVPLEEP